MQKTGKFSASGYRRLLDALKAYNILRAAGGLLVRQLEARLDRLLHPAFIAELHLDH